MDSFIRNILVIFFSLLLSNGFCQNESKFNNLLQLTETHPDSVISLLKSNKLKTELGIKYYCFLQAKVFHNKGDYTQSKYIIRQCFEAESYDNDSVLYYKFISLNAENDKLTGDFDQALPSYLFTLDFYKRKNDTTKIIDLNIRLMEFYRAMEDYDNASKRSIITRDFIKAYGTYPLEKQAQYYNRLAAIFVEQSIEIDSAIILSRLVLKIAKKARNLQLEASSSNELAYLFYNLKMDSVLYYFENAKTIYTNIKQPRHLVNVELNIARHYMNSGKLHLAIQEIEHVIEVSKEKKWQSMVADGLLIKAEIAEHQKDFAGALKLTKQSFEIRKLESENQYSKKLAEISTRYKLKETRRLVEEKQRLVDKLETTAKLERLEKSQAYLFFAVTGILLLIVAFFLIAGFFQNKKLIKSRELLSNSNQKLEQLLELKKVLLQEMNHRVKNNLSVLSGMLFLQQKKLKNHEAIEALKNSQSRISSIALIHESLYQRDDMAHIDFGEYVEKLVKNIHISFGKQKNEVETKIAVAGFTPPFEKAIPLAMLINELISNSFKHAFQNLDNPLIGIEYNKEQNTLLVYDNGNGKLVKKDDSLGYSLVELFAEQLNANLESKNENGLLIHYIRFR